MSGHVLARASDPAALVPGVAATRERGPGDATPEPRQSIPLSRLPLHATGVVAGVRMVDPAEGGADDAAHERMALRLIEIGFVQGAHLRVIAFGQPGNDPIGVRVGGRGGVSTFALRRLEAACVQVWPDR